MIFKRSAMFYIYYSLRTVLKQQVIFI